MALGGGLYKVQSPVQNAFNGMSQAANTYGRMQAGSKTVTEGPGKSVGGAIMGGIGGASMGASIGSGALAGSIGGPTGAAIGAGLGLLAYLFG